MLRLDHPIHTEVEEKAVGLMEAETAVEHTAEFVEVEVQEVPSVEEATAETAAVVMAMEVEVGVTLAVLVDALVAAAALAARGSRTRTRTRGHAAAEPWG